ncbi:MAG: hypothetical protein M1818_004098 [Claussenomyces sp. TS43310]|nr:MAG: hypothetical protein M1818_004098 [Claussenomyces sp. TS43310]
MLTRKDPTQFRNYRESMDPLSVGRERYRRKDYVGALKAFTEAINITTGHLLVDALDHRAATYEKLSQLQSALRDSKEIIDLKPEAAKGYLRCAKVLQLRGDDNLAIKIYERGLKKVKIGTDEDRPVSPPPKSTHRWGQRLNMDQLLQKMFAKLHQKQDPKKNLDPLVMLPIEIAHVVCSFLEMRDLVVCLAVSKPWKAFLESSHALWTTIDLGATRRPISQASLRSYLRRSNYTLQRATFRLDGTGIDESKLKFLAKTCKLLDYLEFRRGFVGESLIKTLPLLTNLRSLVLSKNCTSSPDYVAKILSGCPHLRVAEFQSVSSYGSIPSLQWKNMSSLSSLALSTSPPGIISVDRFNLNELIEATSNLKSFSFTGFNFGDPRQPQLDFSKWTHLEHLNLQESSFMPLLPETLLTLDISRMWHIPGLPSIVLPKLTLLNCVGTPALRLTNILTLLRDSMSANRLEELYLGGEWSLVNSDPVSQIPVCPSVTTLSLEGSYLDENVILEILGKFPSLRFVDLSRTRVTGVTIKELMIRNNRPPERLRLIHCEDISPDAIEHARAMGITVESGYPSTTVRNGRQVWRDRFM